MMDVSLLFKAFIMFPLISLGALHREGFNFSFKADLMVVSKEAYVKFQTERVSNVYILQNSKVTVGELQLSSASKATVVEQSDTTMVSKSEVQLYPEESLGLGAQQGSLDRYSYGGVNSQKSCVDQGDR